MPHPPRPGGLGGDTVQQPPRFLLLKRGGTASPGPGRVCHDSHGGNGSQPGKVLATRREVSRWCGTTLRSLHSAWPGRPQKRRCAPLRSWDDFIPGHDRFAVPDFKDISKWNNRVVSNLLYYQTNYLVVAAVVFSIVGFLNPLKMLLGILVVILVFTAFVFASHKKDFICKFKKHYPAAFVIAIMLLSYILISFFGGVMVFLFGITFPLFLMFLHASLRLRNIKNKMENKIESIGLKKTPMGIILDLLEQQEETISKLADYLAKAKD